MGNEENLNKKIEELRNEYALEALSKEEVADEPLKQLRYWMDEAVEAQVHEPNAMTLATTDDDGRPSTRIVLIRQIGASGPIFFTNYKSRKGEELANNPLACGNMFWPELQRQVRMEGKAEKVDPSVSDAYFDSRPYKSRVGAWASEQSKVIPSRETLEKTFLDLDAEFREKELRRPDHWGGYELKLDRVEFWQGRPDRLHDRIELLLKNGTWEKRRLSP